MPSPPKILFILTSHAHLGDTGKPTGWYLPEFAHPYHVLAEEHNAEIIVASPAGGPAPLDPGSVQRFQNDPLSMQFLKHREHLWTNTRPLEEFVDRAPEFDALFIVGGHGPMYDLTSSRISHAVITAFNTHNKILSAVCHGPAAFTDVLLSDGKTPLVANRAITSFSNAEEEKLNLARDMPFLLESRLMERGARYEKAPEPWGVKVVSDGNLITGQNPPSARGLAEVLWQAVVEARG